VSEKGRAEKFEMLDQQFSSLKVISYGGADRRGATLWRCQCACGRLCTVSGYRLRLGRTKSCGCLRRLRGRPARPRALKIPTDMLNQTFGRLTVVAFAGRAAGKNGALKWACACNCGGVAIVAGTSLRTGTSRSCGCLQRELAAANLAARRSSGDKAT